MVTKEQALNCRYFHYTGKRQCKRVVGPRGGVRENVVQVRANGQCKTWKRDPERFQLPIKYGLYEYSYITNENAADFHVEEDCPLKREGE